MRSRAPGEERVGEFDAENAGVSPRDDILGIAAEIPGQETSGVATCVNPVSSNGMASCEVRVQIMGEALG